MVSASVATATSSVSTGWKRSTKLQRAPVEGDHVLETPARTCGRSRPSALPLALCLRMRAHIIGVSVSETTADRMMVTAKRDGELAEEASHHIAHEQQRDKHSDERYGERQDGEADLPGAFKRRLHRGVAFLQVTRDVLDHHDGVVDDEAGRDGERHQREVVERVA